MSQDKKPLLPNKSDTIPLGERSSTQKTYTTSHLEDKLNGGGSSDKTDKKEG
ncbi:hypothetical protein [Brucella lupini]